jgi:hypothetical protein
MFLQKKYFAVSVILLIALALFSCAKKGGGGDDADDGNNPYNILDLRVVSVSDTGVVLTWTATGDDADVGTCANYDVRYFHNWITYANWDSTTQVLGEPKPRVAGSADSIEVRGLKKDSTYYFAVMACDEADNCCNTSNCVMAMCFVDHPVSFPDANLEAAIRENIHKPTGPLMQSDLTAVVFLDANSRGIADLTGIEQCKKLQVAFLSGNEISDLAPLSTLKELFAMQVVGNNITNVSALANMDQFTILYLDVNPLTDISGLATMSGLHLLWLRQCGLTDLAPLVANLDLADNDTVGVTENPLSQTAISEQIPALEARGVTVLR